VREERWEYTPGRHVIIRASPLIIEERNYWRMSDLRSEYAKILVEIPRSGAE
jgi:hypothetical protein